MKRISHQYINSEILVISYSYTDIFYLHGYETTTCSNISTNEIQVLFSLLTNMNLRCYNKDIIDYHSCDSMCTIQYISDFFLESHRFQRRCKYCSHFSNYFNNGVKIDFVNKRKYLVVLSY